MKLGEGGHTLTVGEFEFPKCDLIPQIRGIDDWIEENRSQVLIEMVDERSEREEVMSDG